MVDGANAALGVENGAAKLGTSVTGDKDVSKITEGCKVGGSVGTVEGSTRTGKFVRKTGEWEGTIGIGTDVLGASVEGLKLPVLGAILGLTVL